MLKLLAQFFSNKSNPINVSYNKNESFINEGLIDSAEIIGNKFGIIRKDI